MAQDFRLDTVGLINRDKELSFKLENCELPFHIKAYDIEILLKDGITDDKPPFGMYC